MISAKVIQHSVSPEGIEIISYELEYPRFIHAEFMTHRLFSRNSASSRAIPVAKLIEMVRTDPAMPTHWGKNQPGMQAKEELEAFFKRQVQDEWYGSASFAAQRAEAMSGFGAHKQIANRILEPFQWMKVVCTFTEGKNFFWLRDHEDAQPEIAELARKMFEAYKGSEAFKLNPGEWHVPYVTRLRGYSGTLTYALEYEGVPHDHLIYDANSGKIYEPISEEAALKVSSSCCAQVSYRLLDQTLEKALMIYDRLVSSEPVHASPFEHQATPLSQLIEGSSCGDYIWEGLNQPGVTHMDKDGYFWSANFKGWAQHRQLIPGNARMGGIING